MTAAGAEVLLSGDADDRFACLGVDIVARDIEQAVLLTNVTITYAT